MIMAFRYAKLRAGGGAERLRLLDLAGIEVDVSVKIADHGG